MIDNYFIATKPLQYFNIRSLNKKTTQSRNIIIIINFFYKAWSFTNHIKETDNIWDEIHLLNSRFELFIYLSTKKINNLYIEYDNSTLIALLCKIKRINLYIVEEGYGSYITPILQKRGIQNIVNRLLGVNSNFGCSSFTKGIYVYFPEIFKKRNPLVKCEVRPIQPTFTVNMQLNSSLFFILCDTNQDEFVCYKRKKILLFLTDWVIERKDLDKISIIKDNYDAVLIKPHPHILKEKLNLNTDFKVIKSNIMAEFVIQSLLDGENIVTVYHYGSTSILYFSKKIHSIFILKENKDEKEQQNLYLSLLDEFKNAKEN